ncbi:uncharacterized protein LOC106474823 isoform X2 [Limulus polyphemus]|uniref:Uncharacterized protein LOC106474823 isoform X2 n=1 Tax=Limulus polyphemus TaxID=6850 RepID=A0ABM1TSH8_LIMPO|nr:uncharacterized protein LOC106474823 isoform X2 [Limulus polyphemus]
MGQKGHYDPKNPKYFTGAKDRFRSNLYKMITDKKLKLEKKGNTNTNECRFYRIIDQELLNSVSISNATALDQNLTTKIITEQRNVSVASPSVLNQNEEICISSDSVLIIIMQESVVDTVPSEPDVDVSEEFMSQYKTGTGKDSQNKNTISKEEVNFEQVQTIVMDHQSPNQDCGLGKDITEKNYTTQSKEFEELDLICNTLDYRDLFSEVEENFVNYLNNPSILEPSQVKNRPVLENQLDFNVLGPDTESLYIMQPSASSEPEMIDNNYFRGIDFLEDSANFELISQCDCGKLRDLQR